MTTTAAQRPGEGGGQTEHPLKRFYREDVVPRLQQDVQKLAFPEVTFWKDSGDKWLAEECPFRDHRRNSRDRFEVRIDNLNWKCWSCDTGGDPAAFVMEMYSGHNLQRVPEEMRAYVIKTYGPEGITKFHQAVRFLAHRLGLKLPGDRGYVAPPKVEAVEPHRRALEDIPDTYENVLRVVYKISRGLFPGSPGEAYMRSRGIDPRQAVGFIPDPETLRRLFAEQIRGREKEFPYWELKLKDLGFFFRDRSEQRNWTWSNRIVIPYSWNGKLTVLYGRAVDWADDEQRRRHEYTRSTIEHKKEGKAISWQRGVFGERSLGQPRVMVVEGALDALAARQFGWQYTVAFGGLRNPVVLSRLEQSEEVWLGLDRDEPRPLKDVPRKGDLLWHPKRGFLLALGPGGQPQLRVRDDTGQDLELDVAQQKLLMAAPDSEKAFRWLREKLGTRVRRMGAPFGKKDWAEAAKHAAQPVVAEGVGLA